MGMRTFGLALASMCMAVLLAACSPGSGTVAPTSTFTPLPTAAASAKATGTASTSATASPTQSADSGSLAVCAAYKEHLYEACFAYAVNDADWSLQPYYKYVHSNSSLSFLKDRLALKYYDQARQVIEQRVANWPNGTNIVDGPEIAILTACSSLDNNRAVLTTRESWTVRTTPTPSAPKGVILYSEDNQLHTVVLHRIPDDRLTFGSFTIHQWVVYELYDGVRNVPGC